MKSSPAAAMIDLAALPVRSLRLANALRVRLTLAATLATLVVPLASLAASIPEPDTLFYGRVLAYDHGYDVLLTRGDMVWKIQPNGDDSRTYELRATLEPIPAANGTNGAVVAFSYRLQVPHEALAAGLTTADLSPQSVALGADVDRYRHVDIRVNGEAARILAPATAIFDVTQDRRGAAHRLDLQVVVALPDTDGHGLPDWWQERFFGGRGTDPAADADADGTSNRQEYLAGTDPTRSNLAPAIVWENPSLDEGTTELVSLHAVDADTPPARLVYSLVEEPKGARLSMLFGGPADAEGRHGDRRLATGDTFTQADVVAGRLAITHEDPEVTEVSFRLRLADGDPAHTPHETTLTATVHPPTPTDGTGAAIWMSSRFATGGGVATWADRSGPKPWLNGTNAPFDARATVAGLVITNLGPLGQPVLALNRPGAPAGQVLALPRPAQAPVFQPGEITTFAVFKSSGDGTVAEQLVSGPHFQLGLTGPEDHGRDSQIRFASSGAGVVYSNRRVRDRWVLVSAWRGQNELAIELSGTEVGGPHPLDPPTEFGTDPTLGGRSIGGVPSQAFEGYLGEVLVFNRNLDDAERSRINYSLLSKWFGWVLLDGTEEARDLDWQVASTGLSAEDYRTNFVPRFGPDRHYILIGGGGHDTLRGGMNDDILVGGRQADVMVGGGGRDVFVFNYAHINHGPDTIADFHPTSERDAINLADLLRGESRDLTDYLHLRTDGHDSFLDIDFAGARRYADHTIVLRSVVLRDDDLPALWARENLITGDKRIPLDISIATATAVATEITGSPAVFDVHLEGAGVPETLEIPFELGGTALRGEHYVLSLQQYDATRGAYVWEPITEHELLVRLKPGERDFAVRVEPLEDRRSQPVRTVQLHLTAVPEWYDVATASAVAQIEDGPQRVAVLAGEARASEAGGPGSFLLRREGSLDVPLDVTLRMTGPAGNGVDYSYIPTVARFEAGQDALPVPVRALPDDVREPAEPAELVLVPGTGYFVDPAGQSATVTIEDSGPVITVEAVEPLAVVQDATPGAFLLRRQGMVNEALVVLLDVGGTAAMNVDFRRVGRVATFAQGATSVLVPVQPIAGATLAGGAETVRITVLPDAAYSVGRSATAEVRLVESYVTFASWKSKHFPNDASSLDVLAAQDTDGDGISNLLEYAHGLDPHVADTGRDALPTPFLLGGRAGIRFVRPVGAIDLAYVIEVSDDLLHWQAATTFEATAEVLGTGGRERVTYLETTPATSAAARFVRVNLIRH